MSTCRYDESSSRDSDGSDESEDEQSPEQANAATSNGTQSKRKRTILPAEPAEPDKFHGCDINALLQIAIQVSKLLALGFKPLMLKHF